MTLKSLLQHSDLSLNCSDNITLYQTYLVVILMLIGRLGLSDDHWESGRRRRWCCHSVPSYSLSSCSCIRVCRCY
jgi:hypothetical protein